MKNISEMLLTELSQDVNDTANEHGFWEKLSPQLLMLNTKLLLIHSEVTEAMDVLRTEYEDHTGAYVLGPQQAEDFFEELADVIIRAFDIAGEYGWNIGETILTKVATNRSRVHKHGKAF